MKPMVGGASTPLPDWEQGGSERHPGAPIFSKVVDPIPPVFVSLNPRWVLESDLPHTVPGAHNLETLLTLIDDPTLALSNQVDLPRGQGVTDVSVNWQKRHQATLELKGKGGAVVGLHTAYWLGWQARQGHKKLPVVRVGFRQVGVVVEDVSGGPIELRYRPPRMMQGIGAFILGALLLLLAWGLVLRRGKEA
jgi:hypothetical protein